ncbi:hypothetical protein F5Y16DRAFT_319729 [Xylariaceae sp. FL0255]|nr:hypothetical protein F5Y16DRAFT_319729 [Xylariaceae sp. FL0255]
MSSPINLLTSAPRLVVTGHNAEGLAIFKADHTIEPFLPLGPKGSSFVLFDERSPIPASNTEDVVQRHNAIPRAPSAGVNFCIANYPPGVNVPMHRTLSRDWCVIMSGEIVVALDNGEEKTLKEGDFFIQAGTNHSWHNRTDKVCRVAFMCMPSEKVKLENGTELEERLPQLPVKSS